MTNNDNESNLPVVELIGKEESVANQMPHKVSDTPEHGNALNLAAAKSQEKPDRRFHKKSTLE